MAHVAKVVCVVILSVFSISMVGSSALASEPVAAAEGPWAIFSGAGLVLVESAICDPRTSAWVSLGWTCWDEQREGTDVSKVYEYRLGGGWASLFGTLCQTYLALQDYLQTVQDYL